LRPSARAFELGSGGGHHLVTLALQGFTVDGIDASPHAVQRSAKFVSDLANWDQPAASRIRVECAEWSNYKPEKQYDLCYHVGVVEHYLCREHRIEIWRRLVGMTRPGGWVVSMVPCGRHFLRSRIRQHRLCGYDIPEIDYGAANHISEFEEAGLRDNVALPTDFLGFYSAIPGYRLLRPLYLAAFYAANLVGPRLPLPVRVLERFAHGLIAIGRRELQ
jgi:SAM-dependent methyltransferase